MPSKVRFDTIFDVPQEPLASAGPVRITSGMDPHLRLDHGLSRGQKIVGRFRVAHSLIGLAAPIAGRIAVRIEVRWDATTDDLSKPVEGLGRWKARALPWSVAGRPGAPLEIKRSKIALGEVIIDGGVVPAGGLLMIEIGATPPAQSGLGLTVTGITVAAV
jgi:hypothetical protein